jgi:hypothetical protein
MITRLVGGPFDGKLFDVDLYYWERGRGITIPSQTADAHVNWDNDKPRTERSTHRAWNYRFDPVRKLFTCIPEPTR